MPLTCKQYESVCLLVGESPSPMQNHLRNTNLLMNKIHRKTELFTIQSPSVVHITQAPAILMKSISSICYLQLPTRILIDWCFSAASPIQTVSQGWISPPPPKKKNFNALTIR
jgi:hypothetical protein